MLEIKNALIKKSKLQSYASFDFSIEDLYLQYGVCIAS